VNEEDLAQWGLSRQKQATKQINKQTRSKKKKIDTQICKVRNKRWTFDFGTVRL